MKLKLAAAMLALASIPLAACAPPRSAQLPAARTWGPGIYRVSSTLTGDDTIIAGAYMTEPDGVIDEAYRQDADHNDLSGMSADRVLLTVSAQTDSYVEVVHGSIKRFAPRTVTPNTQLDGAWRSTEWGPGTFTIAPHVDGEAGWTVAFDANGDQILDQGDYSNDGRPLVFSVWDHPFGYLFVHGVWVQ